MSITENFSQKVSTARKRAGMNQDAFAKAIGYSRNYISMIEGGRAPGAGFAEALLTFEREHGIQSEHSGTSASEHSGSPREKLRSALAARKLTVTQLAKLIKYDAGVINHMLNGTGRASEKMIEAIVRELPELTKEELMGGSDAPMILAEDGMSGTYGAKPTIVLPPGMKGFMAPLLSMAQAGSWDAGHDDGGWAGECVFALNVDDRRAFGITVSGNSMEPEIRQGDVVICSPREPLTNGCVAVVRTHSGQAFVKFWRKTGERVTLQSANPAYEPIHFPIAEIAGAWPVVQRISSGKITSKHQP